MERVQEKCGVIVEFADGTKLLYDYSTDKKPYILLVNGRFELDFETEIDVVQYLLKDGYYKGDERKAVVRK